MHLDLRQPGFVLTDHKLNCCMLLTSCSEICPKNVWPQHLVSTDMCPLTWMPLYQHLVSGGLSVVVCSVQALLAAYLVYRAPCAKPSPVPNSVPSMVRGELMELMMHDFKADGSTFR